MHQDLLQDPRAIFVVVVAYQCIISYVTVPLGRLNLFCWAKCSLFLNIRNTPDASWYLSNYCLTLPGPGLWQVHTHYGTLHVIAFLSLTVWLNKCFINKNNELYILKGVFSNHMENPQIKKWKNPRESVRASVVKVIYLVGWWMCCLYIHYGTLSHHSLSHRPGSSKLIKAFFTMRNQNTVNDFK